MKVAIFDEKHGRQKVKISSNPVFIRTRATLILGGPLTRPKYCEVLTYLSMYIQICIFVGPKCRPGSTGQAYIGVNNKILDPDENGFGEVAVSSRNVFMGYHKDPIRTEESFQGQKDTRTPRPLETLS